MGDLGKLSGHNTGSSNIYWYKISMKNKEIIFVNQDNRFCFDIKLTEYSPTHEYIDLGCIYKITLEDALIILYNLAKYCE